MAELDLATKAILHVSPGGLLAAAWGRGVRVVRALDPHQVTTLRVRDGLFELAGRRSLAHLEVEARPRGTSARRAFEYWCRAQVGARGRRVRTLVAYLRPSPARKPAREHVTTDGAGRRMAFGFDVLCLWTVDAAKTLQRGDPGLLPFVPFMRGATRALVRQALVALARLPRSAHVRGELSVALAVFAGKVFPRDRWLARIPVEVRVASSTYKEILTLGHKEGRKEGLEEGHKEGRKEGLEEGLEKVREVLKLQRDTLAKLLTARWGALDRTTKDRLSAGTARDLARWTLRTVEAERLADVFGRPRRARKTGRSR